MQEKLNMKAFGEVGLAVSQELVSHENPKTISATRD
jgi:hypothetical protein